MGQFVSEPAYAKRTNPVHRTVVIIPCGSTKRACSRATPMSIKFGRSLQCLIHHPLIRRRMLTFITFGLPRCRPLGRHTSGECTTTLRLVYRRLTSFGAAEPHRVPRQLDLHWQRGCNPKRCPPVIERAGIALVGKLLRSIPVASVISSCQRSYDTRPALTVNKSPPYAGSTMSTWHTSLVRELDKLHLA